MRLGVLGELLGVAELKALALVHNHDVVTVNDGVDSVGDGEHCGVFEVLRHQFLDLKYVLGCNFFICPVSDSLWYRDE